MTGFTDGEGSFGIYFAKNSKYQLGYQLKYEFTIALHKKDQALLEKIKLYFNDVGGIHKHGKESVHYRVSSMKDISVLLNHFDNHPLLTQKRGDYILFKRVIALIQAKEHLTSDGFHEILSIRASMNLGLSDSLKEGFPNIVPVERPKVEDQIVSDPNWLVGFVEAEGCFYIDIAESREVAVGSRVQLRFKITQHNRDGQLMESLVKYLGCGKIYRKSSVPVVDLEVKNFSDIDQKIIPFFNKYPLQGVKKENFEDFCKVASLIKSGAHLTPSGLGEIRRIKSGMNTQRSVPR